MTRSLRRPWTETKPEDASVQRSCMDRQFHLQNNEMKILLQRFKTNMKLHQVDRHHLPSALGTRRKTERAGERTRIRTGAARSLT